MDNINQTKNILLVLLITIVIVSFLSLLIEYFKNKTEPYSQSDMEINISDIKTDEKILIVIKTMLKDINTLFKNNHITYWMDGGTLLGAVRHKNIIPWDDDADLAVVKTDEFKLLALKSKLHLMGYGLGTFWGGYKIFPLNGRNIKYINRNWKWSNDSKDIGLSETFNYKYPFIDILLVDKQNDIYHFSNDKAKRVWPKCYHKIENLFPLKEYQFDSFTLIGPNNPIPYLDRVYGNDWMSKGYKQYDHENQRFFEIKKFDLEKI